LTGIHLSPFDNSNSVDEAIRLFDARAARAIRAGVESASFGAADFMDLLELKSHGGDTNSDSEVPDVRILNANALPLMASPITSRIVNLSSLGKWFLKRSWPRGGMVRSF
jgi:hypothetical protein